MALPLIPLAAGAVGLYFLLSGKDAKGRPKVKKIPIKKEKDGRVTTTIPTVDGKGYKLTTDKHELAAIMAMAQTNDAQKMTVMAAQYMNKGMVNEAIACNHLAAGIAVNKANGGQPVKKETAEKVTKKANKPPKTKSKAHPKEKDLPAEPSPALVAELQKVMQSNPTPGALHDLADKFDAEGCHAQAASINAAADELEKSLKEAANAPIPPVVTTPPPVEAPPAIITTPGIATAPQFTPATTPAAPVSLPSLPALPAPVAVQTPALPAPVPQAPPTPRRAAADALVKHLNVDRPAFGRENQALVKAYESAIGATPSGKYGIGLAHSLAEPASGSHVPPAVRYWPSSAASIAKYGNYIKAANDYDSWLMAEQMRDQARSAEWQDAYQHARDFWPSGSKPQPRR